MSEEEHIYLLVAKLNSTTRPLFACVDKESAELAVIRMSKYTMDNETITIERVVLEK